MKVLIPNWHSLPLPPKLSESAHPHRGLPPPPRARRRLCAPSKPHHLQPCPLGESVRLTTSVSRGKSNISLTKEKKRLPESQALFGRDTATLRAVGPGSSAIDPCPHAPEPLTASQATGPLGSGPPWCSSLAGPGPDLSEDHKLRFTGAGTTRARRPLAAGATQPQRSCGPGRLWPVPVGPGNLSLPSRP